jgi:hypothetical protein
MLKCSQNGRISYSMSKWIFENILSCIYAENQLQATDILLFFVNLRHIIRRDVRALKNKMNSYRYKINP